MTKDNDKYGLTDATDKDKNNTQPAPSQNRTMNNINNHKSDLTIIQWNCQNHANIKELRAFLCEQEIKPNIICLQETWLKDKNRLPNIPNYKTACYKNRSDQKGGGVMIFANKNTPFQKLDIKLENSQHRSLRD